MSLPNILTIARIVAILPIVLLILIDGTWARWLALILFAAAAITDWLDGYLARRSNIVSPLGRMLDPIADKMLVAALLVIFAFDGTFSWLDLIPALAILMREVLISGLREHLGNANVVLNVTILAKYKTTAQLIAVGLLIATPLFSGLGLWAHLLFWVAAALTAWTGWDYFRSAWPHLKDGK